MHIDSCREYDADDDKKDVYFVTKLKSGKPGKRRKNEKRKE